MGETLFQTKIWQWCGTIQYLWATSMRIRIWSACSDLIFTGYSFISSTILEFLPWWKQPVLEKGSFKLPMYGGKKQRTPQWIQYFREHPTWNYTWGSTPRWVCRCKYICSLLDTDWIICIYNICKETLQPTCSHPTCIFRLFTVLWTFDFLEQLTAPWQSELFVKSAQQHRFLRQHRSVPSLHHISPPGQ